MRYVEIPEDHSVVSHTSLRQAIEVLAGVMISDEITANMRIDAAQAYGALSESADMTAVVATRKACGVDLP